MMKKIFALPETQQNYLERKVLSPDRLQDCVPSPKFQNVFILVSRDHIVGTQALFLLV